jgi:SAM-dependent methyltransferase
MKDWKQIIEKPSQENLSRVGSKNWQNFLDQGSRIGISLIEQMKVYLRGSLKDKKILDFGCGIGRAFLPLTFDAGLSIVGCDIDATAVSYLKKVVPNNNLVVNKFSPPLTFEDNFFDAVYSISIWTHLSIHMQFLWLEEIRRILKPGGIALISVAGHNSLRLRHQRGMAMWQDINAKNLVNNGAIYKEYLSLNTHPEKFPGVKASYGSCLHDPEYIRQKWSNYFNVLEIKEAYIDGSQDLVVMNLSFTSDK